MWVDLLLVILCLWALAGPPRPAVLAFSPNTRRNIVPSISAVDHSAHNIQSRRHAHFRLTTLHATPEPPPTDEKEYHPPTSDRRTLLRTVGGIALANILSIGRFSESAAVDFPNDKQTILITGCNSGIGYDAAVRLASRGHDLLLACRSLDKAKDAANRIRAETNAAGGVAGGGELIPGECNLASLTSITKYVEGLSGRKIDAVCLNAGLARNTEARDVLRTEEGFELTVGVNHLGHFYLNHLLMPLVNAQSGRIVVTASSVHDPQSPGGAQGKLATLGDMSGLESGPYFDMVDGREFNADKAYKDSKLCNVLFTRELQRRLTESKSNIVANAFTPGLIVSTGLFRDQNPLFTKVFDVAATNLFKVGDTIPYGGGCLEYMALDKTVVSGVGGKYYFSPPGSSKYGDDAYGVQFGPSQVSVEAQDDAKAKKLWELSERLVGISA